MKQSKAGAQHHVMRATKAVSKTSAGIEIFPVGIQYAGGPCLKLPTNAAIKGQSRRGAPFVLDVETIVGVVERGGRLVTNCLGYRSALVDRGSPQKRAFVEGRSGRGVEALEKDDKWIRTDCAGASRGPGSGAIGSKECRQVGEVGFEGIEQGKRLVCSDAIEVPAEAQRMVSEGMGNVIDQLEP